MFFFGYISSRNFAPIAENTLARAWAGEGPVERKIVTLVAIEAKHDHPGKLRTAPHSTLRRSARVFPVVTPAVAI
jgi:hypothetical protein